MISFMSTASLSESTRIALSRVQAEMADAQKVLASGRHADVGKTLGIKTANTISFRGQHARLQTILDTNGVLGSRIELTQSVLNSIADSASSFRDAIIASRDSGQGAVVVKRAAEVGLKAFTSSMNSSFDGAFIFSGINSDVKPVADYFEMPPPANKQAANLAFVTEFGFTQGDAAVSTITAGAIQAYLDGAFSAMFETGQWQGTWSGASSENVQSRISPREIIATSANANEEPFRKLAEAYTMVADLGLEAMNGQARQMVLDKAMLLASDAIAGLGSVRAGLGIAQERISKAGDRMSIEMDIIAKNIGLLENVDAAKVATRISALSIQIETSYALTARLHQMSLVNYL